MQGEPGYSLCHTNLMFGPYKANIKNGRRTIEYLGNKIYREISDVSKIQFEKNISEKRISNIVTDKQYFHLHHIDNAIFFATIEYFRSIGADWCNLPLTTRMISSPGEIYAGKTLDYTTDALPVDINWFDNNKKVFLSESSQFYLELRLLIGGVDKVFSIYNSFRKEKSDYSHMPEFQHIEFEGKVNFDENIKIAYQLLNYITSYLLKNNIEDLSYFLDENDIKFLTNTFADNQKIAMSLDAALKLLFENTQDEKYKEFSLKNFGGWEEIRLTNILQKNIIITDYPLMQIPFYHDGKEDGKEKIPVAKNADIVLIGFREVVGAGVRISDPAILTKKARIFNLPLDDYAPYIETRNYSHYKPTAGFGLGWQRYVQWLLKLPYIWNATHIPRSENLPTP